MLSVLVATFLLMIAVSVQAETPPELFARGNAQYQEGFFDSAVVSFESALKSGVESAPLHFNLGNAYFKSGDLGRAMVSYLRAKRLDPGNEDISQNIAFIRQLARVQMEGVELNPIESFAKSLIEPHRLATLAWWSSAAFILCILCLTARLGFGYTGSTLTYGSWLALALVVVLAGLTTLKYRVEFARPRGVVVALESSVLSGPDTKSNVEFEGSPGLVVEIVGSSGDFLNVLFENKRRGWIRSDAVIRV